ncbi:MAG: RodZ domain-containing protein [Candidatus Kapaibacterium sp.]|jgi:hypothetical protein
MDSIGAYLKNRRETYGLTLDDIYARTKIRHHVIEQIEQDNFSIMPAPYLRSFLRTYCEMVKIEEEEIQAIIAKVGVASKPTPAVIATPVSDAPKQTRSAPPKAEYSVKPLLLRAFIFAGLFLAIVIAIYTYVFKPDPKSAHTPQQKSDSSLLTVVGNTVVGLIDESVTTDSLLLDMRASDQVWITMTADGKFSRQFLLNANEKRSWSAKEFFLLSVSNAGALEIMRNGKPLPLLGEKGEFVRSVKITKDDLIASSSPYTKQVTPSANTTQQVPQTTAPKPILQQPKQELPKKEIPKEKPIIQQPKKEPPKQESPKKEVAKPIIQQPKQELPKKDIAKEKPIIQQPKQESPKKEVAKPIIQQPKQELPKKDIAKEKPIIQQPKKEPPQKEVAKEKVEKKSETTKEPKKESRKERRERRKRGSLEIESVPLRSVDEGLPIPKPLPKQIPPE